MDYLSNPHYIYKCLHSNHTKTYELNSNCSQLKTLNVGKLKIDLPIPIRQGRSSFIRNLYPAGEPELVEIGDKFEWVYRVAIRVNDIQLNPETLITLINQAIIISFNSANIQVLIIGQFGEDKEEEILSQSQIKVKSNRISSFSQKWQGDFSNNQWYQFIFMVKSKEFFILDRDVVHHVQLKLGGTLLYGDEPQSPLSNDIPSPLIRGFIIKVPPMSTKAQITQILNTNFPVDETINGTGALVLTTSTLSQYWEMDFVTGQSTYCWLKKQFPVFDRSIKNYFFGPFVPIPFVQGLEVGYRLYELSISSDASTAIFDIPSIVMPNSFIKDSQNSAKYKVININLLNLESNVTTTGDTTIIPIGGTLTDITGTTVAFNNPNNVLTGSYFVQPPYITQPDDPVDKTKTSIGFLLTKNKNGAQLSTFTWDTTDNKWIIYNGKLPCYPFSFAGYASDAADVVTNGVVPYAFVLFKTNESRRSLDRVIDTFTDTFGLTEYSWYVDSNQNVYQLSIVDKNFSPNILIWRSITPQ